MFKLQVTSKGNPLIFMRQRIKTTNDRHGLGCSEAERERKKEENRTTTTFYLFFVFSYFSCAFLP